MEKYSSYSLYLISFIQHDLKIHDAACFQSLFLCTAEQYSLDTPSIVYLLTSRWIFWIISRYLSIVIKATMNISA